MADLVKELNTLDFSSYIGGPLQAAVQAQNMASMAQVNFIKEVGFKKDGSGNIADLNYVEFAYKKEVPKTDETGTEMKLISISVPFLTMLTIPAIRIDEITIDFNAKLTSTETKSTSSEFGITAEVGAKAWFVNFKASTSYKRSTTTGSQVDRTYSLAVHVRAVNDEIPAGLDRILTLLESAIQEEKV